MRPSLFSNLRNAEIFNFSEFDSQLSNENGYTASGLFPGMTGRDIKGRVDCECEESGRACGAHGMSKLLDFLFSTQSTAPPSTGQHKQHLCRMGNTVGREGLRMRTDSKVAVSR